MRLKCIAAALMSAIAVATPTAPAAAQSFFQQLFGFGSPAPQPAPMPRPQALPSVIHGPQHRRPQRDDDDDGAQSRGGQFRTVCVRMCDGYFFPVSNATSRRMFYRDQMRCRASCGDNTRLFYMPAGATDVDAATDLDGRVYGRLPVAFSYRKSLVAGCQCRPDPWSSAELARHEAYAAAEADKAPPVQTAAATGTAEAPPATEDTRAAPRESDTRAIPVPPPVRVARPAAQAPSRSMQTAAKSAPDRGPYPVKVPSPYVAKGASAIGMTGMGVGMTGSGGLTWPGDAPRRP